MSNNWNKLPSLEQLIFHDVDIILDEQVLSDCMRRSLYVDVHVLPPIMRRTTYDYGIEMKNENMAQKSSTES